LDDVGKPYYPSYTPPSKRHFDPFYWEEKQIKRIVRAIKAGKISLLSERKKVPEERFWDLWENAADSQTNANLPPHMQAPKLVPPGHAESYNPSEEFLFDEV